jgi:membrane-associated protein
MYGFYGLLIVAAILGDTVNYWIGNKYGIKAFNKLINKKYLKDAHDFYEEYGNKAIILARFTPFARTFITKPVSEKITPNKIT